MKYTRLAGSAAIAAAFALPAAAGAQTLALGTPFGFNVPIVVAQNQYGSNASVFAAAQQVNAMIANLQTDQRDYGGHRVAAVQSLQSAAGQLSEAEQYANAHGYGSTPVTGVNEGNGMPGVGQYGSNINIAVVQSQLNGLIGSLEGDARDYGGHRVNAINDLKNAQSQLANALSYAQSNGYGNVGGRPENASNLSVIRAARRVGQMIANLEGDQRDYGGHRVNAINDLQAAENELHAAMQFAESNGYPVPSGGFNAGGGRRGQASSDYSIAQVADNLSRTLANLSHDARDYGGHRINAMNDLHNAQNELLAAEQFAQGHGY